MSAALDQLPLRGAFDGDPVAWADLYARYEPVLARCAEVVNGPHPRDSVSVWRRAGETIKEPTALDDGLVWLLATQHEIESERRGGEFGGEGLDVPEDEDSSLAAVWRLPRVEREVVALRVVAGLNEQRAAEVIGHPVQRVRAIGHRAIAALARPS